MNTRTAVIACLLGLLAGAATMGRAQETLRKAVALQGEPIYISPDASSTPVGTVKPGDDLAVEDKAAGFLRVFAGTSGWMPEAPLVYRDDPRGPEELYAAAMKLNDEAEKNAFERDTATNAARMFYRIYDDFPAGPYTAEALYRSGAIAWKMNMTERPARQDPIYRHFPDDSVLRKVINTYPQTVWAGRATFLLLDEHFTCGRWADKPDCVGKEINVYKNFLKKYPAGPDAPEAEYQIVYRAAAGWTIYNGPTKPDAEKARQYKQEVAQTTATLQREYPNNPFTAQAAKLEAQVAAGTPVHYSQ